MGSQLIPSAHRAPQFFEGINGIVRINEREYQSNMAVQESKLASISLRNTLKKLVELCDL